MKDPEDWGTIPERFLISNKDYEFLKAHIKELKEKLEKAKEQAEYWRQRSASRGDYLAKNLVSTL